MTTNTLTEWHITGTTTEWHVAGDAKKPGASCDHCGTGIAYVVNIRHNTTGHTMRIGRNCAEKVGLTAEALREHYQGIRDAERAERREEWIASRTPIGPVAPTPCGTERKFDEGCRCDECVEAIHPRWVEMPVDIATGLVVAGKWCSTRFGDSFRSDSGEWFNAAKRRSTVVAKGYTFVDVLFRSFKCRAGGRFAPTDGERLAIKSEDIYGEPITVA